MSEGEITIELNCKYETFEWQVIAHLGDITSVYKHSNLDKAIYYALLNLVPQNYRELLDTIVILDRKI